MQRCTACLNHRVKGTKKLPCDSSSSLSEWWPARKQNKPQKQNKTKKNSEGSKKWNSYTYEGKLLKPPWKSEQRFLENLFSFLFLEYMPEGTKVIINRDNSLHHHAPCVTVHNRNRWTQSRFSCTDKCIKMCYLYNSILVSHKTAHNYANSICSNTRSSG